jgi:endonuclease/exonuclease/phosphatase (EEP) superfamily protein YafD
MRLAAVTESPSLSVTHINLGNAENNYDSVINYLLGLDADFISFQELTPDWDKELTRRLGSEFKYIHTMTRLDQYGMGLFSKMPFLSMDTVYYKEIPNLAASIQLDEDETCHILSCQVMPPVNQAAFASIEKHFTHLARYMNGQVGCFIVLGDLHLPPWSSEIQKFKLLSNLQDSRRDINPRNIDGSMSLPRIPVEHIFYCKKFECTSFSELGNATVGRVGITGTYQLHDEYAEVAE